MDLHLYKRTNAFNVHRFTLDLLTGKAKTVIQ